MKKALLCIALALGLTSCDVDLVYYKQERRLFKVLHKEGNSSYTLEDVKTHHVFDGADMHYDMHVQVGDTVTLVLGQRDNRNGQIVIEPVRPEDANLSNKKPRKVTPKEVRDAQVQDSTKKAADDDMLSTAVNS